MLFVQYLYIYENHYIPTSQKQKQSQPRFALYDPPLPEPPSFRFSAMVVLSVSVSGHGGPYGENLGTRWRKVTPEILREEMENKRRKNREQMENKM